MLQKEFEERIGRSVTEQEYVEANAMYMAAGDMDKDGFCREWLNIGNARLVKCLAEKVYQLNRALEEHKLLLKESREIISDAADAFLEISVMEGVTCPVTDACEQKAWWLVGAKEVVLRRIRMGMALTEKDKNYINEHLN